MEFNSTFKNISAISWRSVLLAEETGGPDLLQVTDIEKDFNHTETHFAGNRDFHSSIKSYDVLKIHIRKDVTYKSTIYWSTQ
jgi:hypothetical protein